MPFGSRTARFRVAVFQAAVLLCAEFAMPTLRLEADHGELKFRSPHLSMQIFGFGGMCGKSHKVCGRSQPHRPRKRIPTCRHPWPRLGQLLHNSRFGFLETVTITIIISSRCGEHKEPACAMILPTHTSPVEIEIPSLTRFKFRYGSP